MGGAIARGLALRGVAVPQDITVADPSDNVRDDLRAFDPGINSTPDNVRAIEGSDLVIVAVKPWLMEQVAAQIAPALRGQAVASIVAGVTFGQMEAFFGGRVRTFFRVIPNTAIALGRSVTFISSRGAERGQLDAVVSLFAPLGKVFVIEEEQMTAATALASCGIAYALRYMGAAADGGAEMGLPADSSLEIVRATVEGALALLESGSEPQREIDKVTTPGGITLKGLEEMERRGFSAAVKEGLKASR